MILLFPGIVVGYIPYRLLAPVRLPSLYLWSPSQWAAALILVIGGVFLLRSVWSFAHVGKGTLAPFDETHKLIIVGPYRYVRNPMYIAVITMLLAQSWFFWSGRLLMYAVLCFVVANVLVIGYEENRLKYKYGDEFHKYCKHVGRWIPGKPYDPAG